VANSCWGIFRESTHSPGRESDDTEILRLTGKHLEAKGLHVELKTADEVTEVDTDRPRFVFLMCERVEVLERLRALEVVGVPHVNSPRAVHNTYRDRMIAALDEANVPFIQSRIVATIEQADADAFPVWVKRGDVHNTQEGDVVLAPTAAAIHDALRGLAARGIPRAVLQPHVDGDLIKFYGIGAGGGHHREPPCSAGSITRISVWPDTRWTCASSRGSSAARPPRSASRSTAVTRSRRRPASWCCWT
jgi:hypothetical protein